MSTALAAAADAAGDDSGTVSSLSSQYVALSKNVTLDSALAQGFVEAPVSVFVTVPAASHDFARSSLSLNSVLTINVAENPF